MRFDDAFALVLAWEGGFSDHPDDPGGPTNLGITQRTFSRFYCKPASIDRLRSLKPADVRPIYEEHYWKECRCPELPDGLDLLVFDSAVNQGPGRAKRLLQRSLGVTADGVLGPRTMEAARSSARLEAIDEFTARRAVHYASLQGTFHLGWFRRLAAMHRHALD